MSRYLCGKTLSELREIMISRGLESFRADQLENWFYVRGAKSFDEMSNMGRKLRSKLIVDPNELNPTTTTTTTTIDQSSSSSSSCTSSSSLDSLLLSPSSTSFSEHPRFLEGRAGRVAQHSIDQDGTTKLLVQFPDDNIVETVYIPETDRGTLCISSQVGCTLACAFCQTGTLPVRRNLAGEEIVAQVLLAKDFLGDWSGRTDQRAVSNIVYMGQGEPLFNYRGVARSIEALSSPSGFGISRSRLIVSTSGVVPNIRRLADEFPQVSLAVSLHAPNDALRSRIMDVNARWPLPALLEALRYHQANPRANRLTFEYVLLAGFNDQPEHAEELARLLRPAFPGCVVNLIPFNPWLENSPFKTPPVSHAQRFQDVLMSRNISAPIRRSRGDRIQAACGQLSNKFLQSLLDQPQSRIEKREEKKI